MKAKRETPPPRGGDRRRAQSGASRSTGRRPADAAPARRARSRTGKASAPAREPRASRSAPQTTPISRPVERPARPKNASQAKARAKARKAKAPKVIRPPLRERLLNRLASIDLRPRTLAAKVPFVVLVIGSLGAGLGLTLWLSTDSAERSYQLGSARQQNRLLQQQKEALERDVLEAESAPALAEAARGLGMIPTQGHCALDPGSDGQLGGGRYPQARPRGFAAAAQHQAAGRKAGAASGSAGELGGGADAGLAGQRRARPYRWRPDPTRWSAPRTAPPRWAPSTSRHLARPAAGGGTGPTAAGRAGRARRCLPVAAPAPVAAPVPVAPMPAVPVPAGPRRWPCPRVLPPRLRRRLTRHRRAYRISPRRRPHRLSASSSAP